MNWEKALAHLICHMRSHQPPDPEGKELHLELMRHANAVLIHAKGFLVAWEKLQRRNGNI